MKNIFIILNYNDYKTTKKYVDVIAKFNKIDEIIIIDNNSSDDSYKKLKKIENNKVTILKTDENLGYANGNNYGIKYAIKKYGASNLIISNPDIEIDEKTINNLLDLIDNNSYIALLAPTIEENGRLNRGWKLSNPLDELKLSIPKYGKEKKEEIIGYSEEHYKGALSKVDVVSGCFFIIKSNVIKDVNYFDSNTFLYYEENILGYKLKEKKYQCYISNKNKIIHNHSISIDKSINKINKYKTLKQSQRYYLEKYLQANFIIKNLIKIFSLIMILKMKIQRR